MLQRWQRKFGYAIRGLATGMRGQDSFLVHLPMAVLVLILAAILKVYLWQWCVLILCITIVLVTEYLNSTIEILVRKLHPERDAEIARALDSAAAAVLVASIGAVAVGVIVLGRGLIGMMVGGW